MAHSPTVRPSTTLANRWRRAGVAACLLATVATIGGCHPRAVRAPYQDAPAPQELMAATERAFHAIQVARARVRQKGGSATLMFAAQHPDRFRGTLQIAGNELFSLALRPDGYDLRMTSGKAGDTGFYEGPPSACAISAMIGVALSPASLVTMLLGGMPLADPSLLEADETSQRWSRAHPGHEVLTLQTAQVRQDFRFRWIDDAWRVAGTRVRVRDGEAWRTELDVEHLEFAEVDGAWVAMRTVLQTTDANGESREVKLHLKTVRVDPPSLMPASGESDAERPSEPDTWDDDWDDDHDTPDLADTTPGANPSTDAAQIPTIFFLRADGLQRRGDLCRVAP